jgi:LacI family transcriptional regulator
MVSQMKDVAKRAGVSLTTVSHVLNKTRRHSVSAETRRRVLEAARDLNYHANVHARRLAMRRSNSLGLIISELSNPFFPDIISSFERAAQERGFDLLLCNTEYEPARMEAAVRRMLDDKVRGVAVLTSMFDGSYAKELADRRVPVLTLNAGPAHPRIRQIEIGFSEGMGEAVDHLLKLGHQAFGIISGPLHNSSAVRVRDAFADALARRGLRPCQVVESNYKIDGGMSAVRSLLARPVLPTALLCGNDLIALGAISALHDANVRVPEEISVVGCEDVFFARLARPPLTTVGVPREQLGRLAFEVLEKMQRSTKRTAEKPRVETHLIIRKSTAAPRAEAPRT